MRPFLHLMHLDLDLLLEAVKAYRPRDPEGLEAIEDLAQQLESFARAAMGPDFKIVECGNFN